MELRAPLEAARTSCRFGSKQACAVQRVMLKECSYLPSFQISAASFQSSPTFSQTTTYLPVISCEGVPLVFRLTVPISRAAEGPSD